MKEQNLVLRSQRSTAALHLFFFFLSVYKTGACLAGPGGPGPTLAQSKRKRAGDLHSKNKSKSDNKDVCAVMFSHKNDKQTPGARACPSWRGNTGTFRSDRKRRMKKKKESWQREEAASAVCHCESKGCFTAIASTTKHEFCMMWLKIILPLQCEQSK